MRVGWCSTSLRDEIMRAEQVLISRSNLEVKVNYVSKCQQNPTIKTPHHLSKFPIKTIPVPVPRCANTPGPSYVPARYGSSNARFVAGAPGTLARAMAPREGRTKPNPAALSAVDRRWRSLKWRTNEETRLDALRDVPKEKAKGGITTG